MVVKELKKFEQILKNMILLLLQTFVIYFGFDLSYLRTYDTLMILTLIFISMFVFELHI